MILSRHLSAIMIALLFVPAASKAWAATPARSEMDVVRFDPARTKIDFTLPGNLHTVEGSFALKRGVIRFDPSTGKANGTLIVETASATSGESLRDAEMRDNVLQAQRYPEIIFTPQVIKGRRDSQGDFQAQISGVMHLHGSDHRMTIPIMGRIVDQHLTATCSFVIPYVAWGLKSPNFLFFKVASQVTLKIAATGTIDYAPGQQAGALAAVGFTH